jgi:hypothetical protein
MEIGRKGMIGNDHTSRVWKGERRNKKADSLTRESAFKFGAISSEFLVKEF